jgi:hypothetical protein
MISMDTNANDVEKHEAGSMSLEMTDFGVVDICDIVESPLVVEDHQSRVRYTILFGLSSLCLFASKYVVSFRE